MNKRIDLIRHGEPVGGRRYRGHGVDDTLTDRGWQQMWNALPESPTWDHIVTSPLLRCCQFADLLADKLGIEYTTDERLREIGFGAWEGLTPNEIQRNDPDALDRFLADPVRNRPEGAEPLAEFSQRVCDAFDDIASMPDFRHVLIVGHAGVARAITAHVLGMKLDDVYSRFRVEYGGIISALITEGKPPKFVVDARR